MCRKQWFIAFPYKGFIREGILKFLEQWKVKQKGGGGFKQTGQMQLRKIFKYAELKQGRHKRDRRSYMEAIRKVLTCNGGYYNKFKKGRLIFLSGVKAMEGIYKISC